VEGKLRDGREQCDGEGDSDKRQPRADGLFIGYLSLGGQVTLRSRRRRFAFDRQGFEWRARQDSNLWPLPSEGAV